MAMTVKELKKALEHLPDDQQVIIAKDTEGNAYSPLSGHFHGFYVPDNTWSGEVYDDEDADEYGIDKDLPLALVLQPTN
jgi:hypothetical protein